MSRKLTIDEFRDIVNAFVERRERFPRENDEDSLMVVLVNYGDRFTNVRCINGEWVGIKHHIPRTDGIPKCPNGHVLLEVGNDRWELGLIQTVIG